MQGIYLYSKAMEDETPIETASEQVRIYPTDYKLITDEAKKRRTIAAQIIHEVLKEKYGIAKLHN